MIYEIDRETLRPRSSARNPRAATCPHISLDIRPSVSRSSRCHFPLLQQTASPSPRRPASHRLSTLPSANSARPAGDPQIADPPPATYTSFPGDRLDRSCRSGGGDKAPGALDHSRSCQALRRSRKLAPQTKASHPHGNTIRVSSPRAVARHQIAPTCRCRSETAPPLSMAVSLYSLASTQTTAPRSSAENKAPCRSRTESLPANRRARRSTRRDSTVLQPNNSSDPDRLS